MKKRLTIGIPSYFRGDKLNRVIESTRPLWNVAEVVVYFDSLDDPNIEIVPPLYPEVIFFKKKNEGISSMRNSIIEKSKTEYLLFVDDDDLLCNKFCDWYLSNCEKINLPIYKFSLETIYEDGKVRYKKYPLSFKWLSGFDRFASGHVSSYIIKTDLLKNANFKFIDGLKLSEDAFYWTYILNLKIKARMVRVPSITHIEYVGERITSDINALIPSFRFALEYIKKHQNKYILARWFLTIIELSKQEKGNHENIIIEDGFQFCKDKKWLIFKGLPLADKILFFHYIFKKKIRKFE